MKKIIILAMIVVIGWSTSYADSGDDALRVAYKTGAISKNTYVIERLKSLVTPDQVSPAFRRTEGEKVVNPVRDFTLLLKYATKNIDSFSTEDQEIIRRFQARPDVSSNTNDDFPGGWYLPAGAISTPAGGNRFLIHYILTDISDSGNHIHQTTTEFINDLVREIDTVYASEITTMGYSMPPNDDDSIYDIYVMDCGSAGYYGYVAVDDPDSPVGDGDEENEYTSFMVIDNDFDDDFSGTPLELTQVTLAHEFHHAIQNGINGDISAWWYYETTSTWMEEQVYTDVDDNRQYLSDFFDNPERSLDTTGNLVEYGTWIFNEYLSSKWGATTIKDVWDALDADGNDDPVDAITSAIVGKGSTFKIAFTDFVAENYSKEIYSESAVAPTAYVSVKFHDNLSLATADSSTSKLTTIDHLASRYIKITPSSSDTADLTITINGADTKDLNAVAIVKTTGSTFTKHPITLDSTTNDGSITIANFSSSTMSEVVLALVNYSKAQDSSEITYSASTGQSQSDSDSSSGCFINSTGFLK